MKKRLLFGAVLFLSIAANVTLGSMLIGKQVSRERQPVKMMIDQLDTLPESSREKALQIVSEQRPQLREYMEMVRDTRKAVFEYIASAEYERAEAEKKLTDLRTKTTALQETAQKMMLDIADELPPQERGQLLKKRNEAMP